MNVLSSTDGDVSSSGPVSDGTDRLRAEAIALHAEGKLSVAAAAYRDILALRPHDAEVWHLLGIACLQGGELRVAIQCFDQSIAAGPGQAEPLVHRATALRALDDFHAALISFEQALRIDPTLTAAWVGLGELLQQMGETTSSLDCLQQALALDPDHADALALWGNAQQAQGQTDGAIAAFHRVLALEPNHLAALVNLASILRARGDLLQALQHLQRAASLAPESPLVQFNLANTLTDAGRFAEAERTYLDALELHPQPAKVLFNLSSVKRFTAVDEEPLQEWAKFCEVRARSPEELVWLNFALGKAYDDLKRYDEAFAHYAQGNALARVEFSPSVHRRKIDGLIAAWTPERIARLPTHPGTGPRPIFIVGLPRSGTSLLEQILSRHPDVLACGERDDLDDLLADLRVNELESDQISNRLEAISQTYFQRVAPGAVQQAITDKTPLNFLSLGWISACFPRAIVLHCQRDPRDVCLSCYFQHFTRRLPFAYDLSHLVAFHQDSVRLMSHWKQVLPVPILDVSYEQLVEHPEPMLRKILSVAGLDWTADCLQPHLADRVVGTASHWQARQPIYRTSTERWRRYERHIAPLLEAFGTETLRNVDG